MSALFIGSSSISRLVEQSRLKRQTVASERQRGPAGRAIDRDRSVGDSPTAILYGGKRA